MHELFTETSISTELIQADVPLWERLIVYDSSDNTPKMLTEDEQEGHFIHLVEIANYRQLGQMLEHKRKFCQPDTALYMCLDPKCPVYWLVWEYGGDTNTDIISPVPPSANRLAVVSKVCVRPCGTRHPRIIRVRKQRHTDNNKDTLA